MLKLFLYFRIRRTSPYDTYYYDGQLYTLRLYGDSLIDPNLVIQEPDDIDEIRFLVSNPEQLYDRLWYRHHASVFQEAIGSFTDLNKVGDLIKQYLV